LKKEEIDVKQKFLMLLSIIFITGCGGRETELETEITVPVSVMEVKIKPIDAFIIATGSVYPSQDAVLKSETSGLYYSMKNPETGRAFALGEFVHTGQHIIRLEDKEFENSVKIESQKLNLDISSREFEKQESLYEKGGVTLRELKNAEMDYINAKYSYQNAQLQLVKLKITVPFDGVIVDMPYYTQGTRVATNQVMVEIMNYNKLVLDVNLPGKDLELVKKDQPVRIMNYNLPEDTLAGTISQVSPAIDPTTRTFKASIKVNNHDLLMRPGMFVKTDIIVAREDSALVIPKDIILSRQRGNTVFIVQRGAAQERIISIGLENPDEIQVTRGLRLNDRVVVKGYETLQNRSKVKIIQ
jgi:RND family efflux transporter MFP subunit